jgi:hypothetical protein
MMCALEAVEHSLESPDRGPHMSPALSAGTWATRFEIKLF